MKMTTPTQTVLNAAIASLALLALAATPSFADTHNQTAMPTCSDLQY